jgi:hypothetical protein
VKRYPITKELYQTGRITQDAIHALLCELYLWKKDYQNCIRYADMVIDSKKAIYEENRQKRNNSSSNNDENLDRFNGFPLVGDSKTNNTYGNSYTTLFGSDRNYTDLVNQEIIFQLVFDDSPSNNSMPANGAVNSFYGNSQSTTGLVAPSDYIYAQIEATGQERKVFADRNKKLDSRIYTNCLYSNSSSSSSDKAIRKYTSSSITIDASTGTLSASYSIYSQNQNGSNWVIYRLTDIMLMKAEALTQMMREGSDAETSDYNRSLLDRAFVLVNAVNKRALCQNQTQLADTLLRSNYSSKGDMETLVLQERQRELMFEGKRWFDLVRLSQRTGNTTTLKAAALQKATTGEGLISNHLTKMDAIYWPYNLDEMKVNHNLVQNPAFGSGENESYEKTTKK